MRIAVITANIGAIDIDRPIPKQSIDFDRFYFRDGSPYPRYDFSNRLKAKFFKVQSHNVDALQQYDVHVWIDAAYQIISSEWLQWMIHQLQGFDITVTKHQERSCIYKEADFVQLMIARNNHYIRLRYQREPIKAQADHYRSKGYPANNGLYACGMFARWNNKKNNDAFNDWWIENCKWSIQDQLSFPVVAREHQLSVNPIDINLFNNPYFAWKDHKK